MIEKEWEWIPEDWKEKKIEDSLERNESFKSLSNESKVHIGGQYAMVLPEILKKKEVSAGAKYLYVWLLIFKRFDPKRGYYGKAIVSNKLLEREARISRHTAKKYRKELVDSGLVTLLESDKGCVYTFLIHPKENDYCEKVTKNFLYCDSLTQGQKKFIVSLLPYIYKEVDRFGHSNSQLAEFIGLSAKQVRNHMNEFEKMGLLKKYDSNRGFDLIQVMSGMSDKIDQLLAEISEKDEKISLLEEENKYLKECQKIAKSVIKIGLEVHPEMDKAITENENDFEHFVTGIIDKSLRKSENKKEGREIRNIERRKLWKGTRKLRPKT